MSENDQAKYDEVYAKAVEIIRREWLDAGMTEEEWERSERAADEYCERSARAEQRRIRRAARSPREETARQDAKA